MRRTPLPDIDGSTIRAAATVEGRGARKSTVAAAFWFDMVNDEFSTFKRHSAWFAQRASGHPRGRHATGGFLEPARASLGDPDCPVGSAPVLSTWRGASPHCWFIPHDPRRLLAGAAAGGVWSSHDGGAEWRSCWPCLGQSHIGALAFAPGDPDTSYCATGEANLSPDCYAGNGIYVSRDGGSELGVLATPRPAQPAAQSRGDCCPRPGKLYLGGLTHDENDPGGLYASTDGGTTWMPRIIHPSRNYACHSLVAHPEGFLLAGLELGGAQTGIWRSGWKRRLEAIPRRIAAGDKTGRISLAISPSRPDTVYALVANRLGSEVLGVYRSSQRRRALAGSGRRSFFRRKAKFYNNTIAVHPEDPDTVVCGSTISISAGMAARPGGAPAVGTPTRTTRYTSTPINTPSYSLGAIGFLRPTMAASW